VWPLGSAFFKARSRPVLHEHFLRLPVIATMCMVVVVVVVNSKEVMRLVL
jgi:hypothetical protein